MKTCPYCGRQNDDRAKICAACEREFVAPNFPNERQDLEDPSLSPVAVATFKNLVEADVFKSQLEAAGIEAYIPEEYTSQVFSNIMPLANATVRVAAKDYEAAKALFTDYANTPSSPALPNPSQQEISRSESDVAPESPPLQTADLQNLKACVACRESIPTNAEFCPKCGYTQPDVKSH